MAEAMNLDIPPEQMDRIAASLDGLHEVFGPLEESLPHEVEPAVIFKPQMEDEE